MAEETGPERRLKRSRRVSQQGEMQMVWDTAWVTMESESWVRVEDPPLACAMGCWERRWRRRWAAAAAPAICPHSSPLLFLGLGTSHQKDLEREDSGQECWWATRAHSHHQMPPSSQFLWKKSKVIPK